MTAAVTVNLLGGFAVSGEAALPPVRGLIPQGVVARLALAAGAPVPADALVADLWAEPPDGVLSSLRAHVSRLRSRGWIHLLSGGREGYRLDVSQMSVDALALQALAADTGAERADRLIDALTLWRSHPFAWAAQFPFAATATAQLSRVRDRAAVDLATLRIAAGDATGAVDVLAALVAEPDAHPDDTTIALLARALTLDGRPGEALGVLDGHTRDHSASAGAVTPQIDHLREAIVRRDPAVFSSGDAGAGAERIGIPHPLTRFIGRNDELEAIRRARAASRLITLTGAAGVGKTRLAVEAASRGAVSDDDIQWMVDLTPTRAEDLLHLVATVTGAASATVAAVERVIGGRRGLLILDNAEHVLGATAAVCAEVLGACAGLTVLVTSREALRLSGERVVQVAPLTGEHMQDAMQIFLERAGDASGVHEWGAGQLASIERLCTALDGLPLAIELAASRLDVLSIEELSTSFSGGSGTVAPAGGIAGGRHESVEAAIEWSVRLTTPAERELLVQLAGFAGPFTLDMVVGICVVPGVDVRELAVALARKSLVHTLAGAGGRRFRLLESVKQFARRHLTFPDGTGWSARHAAWCAERAQTAQLAMVGHDAAAARAETILLRADLDQAVGWALAHDERRAALVILGSLGRFWSRRGGGTEVLRLLDRALEMPGEVSADVEAPAWRAAAYIASVMGDPLRVLRYNRRHLEAALRAVDPVHGMLASIMCAHFAAAADDEAEAERLMAEAARYRDLVGDESAWAVADYLCVRGLVLRMEGRPAASLESLGQAFRFAGDIGYAFVRGSACLVTARALIEVGRADEALPILRTGMLGLLEADDPSSALDAVSTGAVAFAALERLSDAAEMFGAVDALGARFGYLGNFTEPDFYDVARARVAQALSRAEWNTAYERGRGRSMQWAAERLRP